MAIHAPAHRPAYHFHFALPHADASETGIVMLVVGVVVMLAITWGAMARTTMPATTTTEGYSAAMTAAAYDGSAAIVALQVRQAGPMGPQARGLVLFRAGERAPLIEPEARSLLQFRAGERAPLTVSEAQGLVQFRAGERPASDAEAKSLLLFRAGEREGR